MESLYLELTLAFFLCCGTAAFAYIFYKLSDALDVIDGSDEQLGEIKGSIEMLGPVLGRLLEAAQKIDEMGMAPDQQPNILGPLIDAFAASIRGENPSIGIGISRDSLGRFIDGTETQSSSETTPTSETHAQSITGA